MKAIISTKKSDYQVELTQGRSLAIDLDFNQHQPNHFDASLARKAPMSVDGFIGDTKKGGSCNVNELTFNPHCNGTHTETIGHICHQDLANTISISQLKLPALMPCVVISIKPLMAEQQPEEYILPYQSHDKVITKQQLAKALSQYSNEELTTLAIRTLPNEPTKCFASYNQTSPNCFFTTEAITFIYQRGVSHLIVDMPSIDRLNDQGLLNNHRIFWQISPNEQQVNAKTRLDSTITELAYINNKIADGFYFINLQMPAFVNDAAPSQPILFDALPITSSAVFKE